MKHGEAIPKILELLQKSAESTVYLLDVFMSSGREAYRKARRGPRQFKTDWAFEYRRRQSFYSLLNQLKNQGLVEKKKYSAKSFWNITRKGTKKLSQLRSRKFSNLSAIEYTRSSDKVVRVVVFDIPEKERYKRFWLRTALTALGFSLLQQSVWVGKVKIPEKFIHDLRNCGILPHVHIFEVGQKGTLHQPL